MMLKKSGRQHRLRADLSNEHLPHDGWEFESGFKYKHHGPRSAGLLQRRLPFHLFHMVAAETCDD